ncbi:MAG: nucleotidyltransferase domain-containing protein [Flavobacterium sp.]|jgi:predicted nucleotidyltransferase|uniref:nucleotidyltransferase family protein n=1 Tax=Flavobacterium TaxID=237 RepID=UPI0022C4E332|nr:nucleotidyltransferase domain-containing protein [Flavobacterium sp.]MCZ8091813.1 nucleotidyltransferase domain-containing protein [Flavobacterium sp.]MCZ8331586.1 nucleotidyltransferase domain-containing protein [Flavobacterium sp.]
MIFDNKKIKENLIALCIKHNVKFLFAFGSVIRDDFDENNSDIDLIVDINIENPIEKGEHLMQFWSELEQLFHKKVDLLSSNSIKNPILKQEIENSKKLIYAA